MVRTSLLCAPLAAALIFAVRSAAAQTSAPPTASPDNPSSAAPAPAPAPSLPARTPLPNPFPDNANAPTGGANPGKGKPPIEQVPNLAPRSAEAIKNSRDVSAEKARPAVPRELRHYAERDLDRAFVTQSRFEKAESELQRLRQMPAPEALERAISDLVFNANELKRELGDRPPKELAWVPSLEAARTLHEEAEQAWNKINASKDAYDAAVRAGSPEAQDHLTTLASQATLLKRLAQGYFGQLMAARADVQRLASANKGLVVSGGVSLGAHQAGFLYYYGLYLKYLESALRRSAAAAENVGRFRVATGASAGSINALLALLDGCRKPQYEPEKSLFFTSWVDVGLDQLFRPEEIEHRAIFSPKALDRAVDAISDLLVVDKGGWLDGECDAYLGVTATRIRPRYVAVAENDEANGPGPKVPLQRQTEKFLIRIRTKGRKSPTLFSHRLTAEPSGFHQEIYPTLGMWSPPEVPDNQAVQPRDLLALLRASAAFPVAFPPVEVPVTVWRKQDGRFVGHPEMPAFSDGGILDNTPFWLARRMVDSLPNAGPDANYVFLKSDSVLWRRPGEKRSDGAQLPQSLFGVFIPFLVDFINGASDNELIQSLEDNPSRELPGRGAPVAGELLRHFFAFVERDFRVFDFYQGMVDAFHHVRNHASFQDVPRARAAIRIRSATFDCFLAYRERLNADVPQNEPPKLPNECVDGDISANLSALLHASAALRRWEWRGRPASEGADEFEVFVDALAARGFRYSNFGGNRTLTSFEMKEALREKMQIGARRLLSAQDGTPSMLGASVLGKSLTNYYHYRAPSFFSLGLVNGLETSGGWVLGRRAPFAIKSVATLRALNAATYVRAINGTSGDRVDSSPGIDTTGIVDLRSEWAMSPVLQLELGAGYELRYRWRSTGVADMNFIPVEPMSYRHGPMAMVGAVLFQHLYAGFWLTRYVNDCGDLACVDVAFRDYAVPVEGSPWSKRLSVGWRFLH